MFAFLEVRGIAAPLLVHVRRHTRTLLFDRPKAGSARLLGRKALPALRLLTNSATSGIGQGQTVDATRIACVPATVCERPVCIMLSLSRMEWAAGPGDRRRMPRLRPAILMPVPGRNAFYANTPNNLPCEWRPPQRLSHARMRSAVPRLQAAASSVFPLQPAEAPLLQKTDEGEMNVLHETKPRSQVAANVYLAVNFPAPLSPHPVRSLLIGISFQARRR